MKIRLKSDEPCQADMYSLQFFHTTKIVRPISYSLRTRCSAGRSFMRPQWLNPEQLGQIWSQYSSLILSEFGLWSNFWNNIGFCHKINVVKDLTNLLQNTEISSWNFSKFEIWKMLKKKSLKKRVNWDPPTLFPPPPPWKNNP